MYCGSERYMINIAIVDNEESARKSLRECLRFCEIRENVAFDIREFSGAEEFLLNYAFNFDIVFMDIMMGATNGIDAAKALRRIDQTVILIFVTNMAQLAVSGYDVDALDFIVKPVDKQSFLLKMKRALGRIVPRAENSVVLNIARDLVRIDANTLRYIETEGHYVSYHFPDNVYREYITFSAAEKKINVGTMVRCNKGTLVNLRYVVGIKKDVCVLDTGEELLIASARRNDFIKSYVKYLGGGGR